MAAMVLIKINTHFKIIKHYIMKKILMLAMICSLATGAFANSGKPKKSKKAKQCSTQQTCKPSDCKPAGCCPLPVCIKAKA